MVVDFSILPPEINSARIFAGAGSGPLHIAAVAWDGLAADLQSSATSFQSVITALAAGPWAGPASVSMAAAAAPYVGWLTAAAAQASSAGVMARAAATAFEAALAATVHPVAVTSNRTSLSALVATNILGQNTPAIFENEFHYMEMWAQDVGAMLGYHVGATSVASTLAPFSVPPLNLAGLGSGLSGWVTQVGSQVAQLAPQLASMASTAGTSLVSGVQTAVSAAPAALSSAEATISGLPISSLSSLVQTAGYPASMLMSPMMSLLQSANGGSAGLANAATAGLADMPKLAGEAVPEMKALGGGAGGLGSGMSAGLGQARLVGAMSVPPTWQGSMPSRMVSSAMSGLGAGGVPNAAMAGATGGTGGMPMMPMPMGGGAGAGGGMPGGMMGRGGASPHVTQNRPSVIPRTGVG